MNKHLLKIAEQSGMMTWGIGNDDNVTESVDKFAELLIEKVLEYVNKGFDPMDIKQLYKE